MEFLTGTARRPCRWPWSSVLICSPHGRPAPKISGFEATRRLRAEPATADTPIIAITSFALKRGRAAGEGCRGVHVPGEASIARFRSST